MRDGSLDRTCGSEFQRTVLNKRLQRRWRARNYIGCGPTFPSTTKSFTEFPGLRFLGEVIERISIPAFAIGGIDATNLSDVINVGMRRVALSSAIHASNQPFEQAAMIKARLLDC